MTVSYLPAGAQGFAQEVERDRFNRPVVRLPDGSGTAPYTRCTTFVDCLEDKFNLQTWQQRMVASGLAQRGDLLLRASSLGPEPQVEAERKAWKTHMNEVCNQAREAAEASAKATIGTALHALTERIDRGLEVGSVPPDYLPHLRAYEAATSRLTAVHIETFTVLDDLRIGGTPDRVVAIDGEDGLFIADVKTGNVEFGLGKMAMQLSVYARSLIYDPATGERRPYAGPVSTDRGVIIALDAATGQCDLFWIDLAAGWHAVAVAERVRAWRAFSRGRKLRSEFVGPARDLVAEAAAALIAGIENAATAEELVQLWTAAGPAWTDQHTELARLRKAELSASGFATKITG